jgi:hypothetical protein
MSMLGARKPKKWIQGAVKHPGALTAEAQASGRSKLEQAEVDAKSSDPHKRGRGLLGERFLKHKI